MDNIIFTYDTMNLEPGVGLGNNVLMKQVQKTARQLVDYIGIEQTEEEFQEFMLMSKREQYIAINNFREKNSLYLFNPS